MKRKLKNYQEHNWYSRYSPCKSSQISTEEEKKSISTPTENYILKKFHEATTLLKQKFVEAAAPDQTDEYISQVLNSSNQNSDEEKQVSSEIWEHLCTFKQSDSFGKTIILSLIDHKKIYTISKYFQLFKIFIKKSLQVETSLSGNWISN